MKLCLDIGNTQLYGGIFQNDKLEFQFRKTSNGNLSSDELGVFLKSVLRENGFHPEDIKDIALCSVVPDKNHSVTSACKKYFNIDPFLLQAGVKTGLKIKYNNPHEVGADRIANAIAASRKYPHQNIIIVDFGTATTFCVISKNSEYLGGVILPGLRISMEALEKHTAKLPRVEIKSINKPYGKSTNESIQIGLYIGHLGIVKEISGRIINETFQGEKTIVLGTGGFSSLFYDEGLFDKIDSTLVLQGLNEALKLNKEII